LEMTKARFTGFLLLSILVGAVIGASLAKPSVGPLASTIESTSLARRSIRVSAEGRASSKPEYRLYPPGRRDRIKNGRGRPKG
jgi:hypothetical protein